MRNALLALTASLLAVPADARADGADTAFLDFPYVETVRAAKVPAFAWLTKQANRSTLLFAKAPDFHRSILAERDDDDGQPITELELSGDGKHVVFTTGQPRGDMTFNPASLVDAPQATLWFTSTTGGTRPVRIGPGVDPHFSDDGKLLLFKSGGDLMVVETTKPSAKPKIFAKGGASWSQFVWTKSGDLIFIDNRRGYSFLGRYHPGAKAVVWLVTGVDRLARPVLSPSGNSIALLRLPGRKHSATPDQTEAEPFSISLVDLKTGAARSLWASRDAAITLGMDDPEGALRWVGEDELVFYSEDDNWGRLYALPIAGGGPVALTPANCMVAESEERKNELLVIHNCEDRDTRQISMIDARSGARRAMPRPEPVLADLAIGGDYAAFVGASANQAPLLRIIDLATGKTRLAETYADYGYTSQLVGPVPREVHLTSLDGLAFTGQLFVPGGPGPHPGLVYVHGGPQRQMFPAFSYMGYYSNDYAMNRRLAEQGYEVLSINYRSGIGYGRAFRDAPGRAWREASEYQDVLSAGRWLARQPGVDPGKIGIWGGSYGGLLTGQALSRNSDLFKAGVGIHGVYDWSWPSPIKGHLSPSTFFGVDEKDRDRARAVSPVGHLSSWRSPVLLIHGDSDMNVDFVETVDLAERLRERGVEVRTLVFPGEAHEFIRHATWLKAWQALDSYFLEKLPPPKN